MHSVRRGLTLIELLVVISVVGMLAGLLMPAIQSAREAARKAECGNHLRQLGIAFSSYHDEWRVFPNSGYGPWPAFPGAAVDPWSHPTFYTSLLPYLDQRNQTPAQPRAIASFLCPSRRTPAVGPKDDYASGRNPDEFYQNGWASILGGPYASNTGNLLMPSGVGLNFVTGHDGSSNTLLLAHKAMRPSQYSGLEAPGTMTGDHGGWAGPSLNFEHERDPRFFLLDTDAPEVVYYIGSPHPDAMPVLFADGSVRRLSYETRAELIPRLWAFNDGTALTN